MSDLISTRDRVRVLFAALHESARGTKLPNMDVRSSVAIGGIPDMKRTAQFGRD
jgi:hypothetical protein